VLTQSIKPPLDLYSFRKLAAKEREETKKEVVKVTEKKKKEDSEWEIKDKAELAAIERKVNIAI
jgi:hypothetical protein